MKSIILICALPLFALIGCSVAGPEFSAVTSDNVLYLVKKQMTGESPNTRLEYVIDPFAGEIRTHATAKILFKSIVDDRYFKVSQEMTTTAFVKAIEIGREVALGNDGFIAQVTSRDSSKIQLYISNGKIKLDMAVDPNKPMIEFMYGSFGLASPIQVDLSLKAAD